MAGQWIEFSVAFLAVGLLVLAVHLARFPSIPLLDGEAEARRIFRLMPGGFEPVHLTLDRNMASAIASDAQSRVAILRGAGAQFIPMLVDQIRNVGCLDGVLMLDWGGDARRNLELQIGADAPFWAKQLADLPACGNDL